MNPSETPCFSNDCERTYLLSNQLWRCNPHFSAMKRHLMNIGVIRFVVKLLSRRIHQFTEDLHRHNIVRDRMTTDTSDRRRKTYSMVVFSFRFSSSKSSFFLSSFVNDVHLGGFATPRGRGNSCSGRGLSKDEERMYPGAAMHLLTSIRDILQLCNIPLLPPAKVH